MATDKQDSLIFYKSEDGNIQLNVKLEKIRCGSRNHKCLICLE